MNAVIRKAEIIGATARLPLTGGYFAEVDIADLPVLEQFNWCAMVGARATYAGRCAISPDGKRTTIRMHRFLTGAPFGLEVDHIDGDGLNNTRANLRIVSHAQNQHNRRKLAPSRSAFKGVSFYGRDGTWRAMIWVYGKRIHLGYFATEQLAAEAYRAASVELHGDFGRT